MFSDLDVVRMIKHEILFYTRSTSASTSTGLNGLLKHISRKIVQWGFDLENVRKCCFSLTEIFIFETLKDGVNLR